MHEKLKLRKINLFMYLGTLNIVISISNGSHSQIQLDVLFHQEGSTIHLDIKHKTIAISLAFSYTFEFSTLST